VGRARAGAKEQVVHCVSLIGTHQGGAVVAWSGSFGEQLRRRREAMGLSQDELAERAGLTANAIGALERGERRRPYPHTVRRLADALGLGEAQRAALAASVSRTRGDAATRRALTVAGGYPAADDRLPNPTRVAASAARAAGQSVLPGSLTDLLGREREVTAVGDLLRRQGVRLVTVTGPGGVGKTRLAVQVAREVADLFPDGVAFVSLAPLRESALIPTAIAQALGVEESGGLPVDESLATALGQQHLLLVLDNCEHLLAGTPVVADVLGRCPGVKVLATSRAPLRLGGEHRFPVAPLAVPDPTRAATPAAAAAWPAVRLFVERARAAQPAFSLTPDNLHAVLGLCRRLDGLPLALELAAARLAVLSPCALLDGLERRLPLLTGGARDAPARHRALRDAIAWSYDLLSASEQRLFRRLAAFAGGWTLALAEEVCADAAEGASVLHDLLALAEHSLVQPTAADAAEPRFGLLETVREHALERLEASGEGAGVRLRHARACLRLAEEAEPHLVSAGRGPWLRRIELELDNIRAALAWSTTPAGDAELGQRLVGSLAWFWILRGRLQEGRLWSERLLARTPRPTTAAARALHGLGGIILMMQGDAAAARAALEESVARFRAEDDRRRLAHALAQLGRAAAGQRDPAVAQVRYHEALRLARAAGDGWLEAFTLTSQGATAELVGDHAGAEAGHRASLALFERLDDQWGRALALRRLGGLMAARGDFAAAVGVYEQSVALLRQTGYARCLADALLGQGTSALRAGAVPQARALLTEALAQWRALGLRTGIGRCIAGLAGVAAAQGEFERATRLYAAVVEAGAEPAGFDVPEAAGADRTLAELRAHLADTSFTAAWSAGRAMTLDEASVAALAGSTG
jgi:predicted ATPase/transcriptional regulator with XRE-family HTH domain